MGSLGYPRHYFDSIPSTMDLLTDLALAGAPEGTVVVAGEQTEGRGRAGRSWNAPAGRALLLSLLLRPRIPAADLPPLPLIAGLAIAEGIEAFASSKISTEIKLKWPNDIFLEGLKLAGVLMQTRVTTDGVEFVILGVGLNVNTPQADLPPGATSLAVHSGQEWPLEDLERSVLDSIARRYDEFVAGGSEAGLDAWVARSLYLNEVVEIVHEGETLEGRNAGIASNGALLLETAKETLQIVAGDLVRGPRPR